MFFSRSERVKSDPRCIDTFGEPFPAVLSLKSCGFSVENVGASRVQIRSFTSRETIQLRFANAHEWQDRSDCAHHGIRRMSADPATPNDQRHCVSPKGTPASVLATQAAGRLLKNGDNNLARNLGGAAEQLAIAQDALEPVCESVAD